MKRLYIESQRKKEELIKYFRDIDVLELKVLLKECDFKKKNGLCQEDIEMEALKTVIKEKDLEAKKSLLINKVVRIIGNSSVFTSYVGRYGIVSHYAYGDKWMIQFDSSVGSLGGISHTVSEQDFEVVGQAYENIKK